MDVQASSSIDARKAKDQGGDGSDAISQKDERNANQKAKEEHPEAPGPVIGMNSGKYTSDWEMLTVVLICWCRARLEGMRLLLLMGLRDGVQISVIQYAYKRRRLSSSMVASGVMLLLDLPRYCYIDSTTECKTSVNKLKVSSLAFVWSYSKAQNVIFAHSNYGIFSYPPSTFTLNK